MHLLIAVGPQTNAVDVLDQAVDDEVDRATAALLALTNRVVASEQDLKDAKSEVESEIKEAKGKVCAD